MSCGAGEIVPRQLKRRALSGMGRRFHSSWFYAEPGFEPIGTDFGGASERFASGEVIWHTRHKSVRKVALSEQYGGITLAFKTYQCAKPARYLLRCSPAVQEAANYRAFTALGIPMATLLFVGEERRLFRLKRSFLATRFAEGYADGRDFLPGGRLRGSGEQKKFIERNLAFIARLHAIHCFHRGVRVFNFLWKVLDNGELDIIWIDVASCRFLLIPNWLFRRCVIFDLADFFRDLALSDAELRDALRGYLAHNPRCGMPLEALFHAVNTAIRPRLRLPRELAGDG